MVGLLDPPVTRGGLPYAWTACAALVRASHCCVIPFQILTVVRMFHFHHSTCTAIVSGLMVYPSISEASVVVGMYGPTICSCAIHPNS